MKKILAILLAASMVLSLAACGGNNDDPDTDSDPVNTADVNDDTVTGAPDAPSAPESDEEEEDALTILTKIWEAYPADEEGNKFMTFGGDYNEENQVENAPGWHNTETEDDAAALDNGFGLPADMIDKVGRVAVMRHMLNVNTFTCSAYEVPVEDDVEAVCQGVRDGLMGRSYMCGWPEQLEVYTVGKHTVVCFFGAADIVSNFKEALTSVYGDSSAAVFEEDMSEAGGDNTLKFPVPELG